MTAPRCCKPGGYLTADKVALLQLLDRAGLDLPAEARVFGPGDGYRWRIVDYRGRETLAVGHGTVEETLAAGDGLAWIPGTATTPHIVPAPTAPRQV